jgi:hypothetical protein
MENLYRIEECFTNDWQLAAANLVKLTKEECKLQYELLVQSGHNPEYLRIVVDQ